MLQVRYIKRKSSLSVRSNSCRSAGDVGISSRRRILFLYRVCRTVLHRMHRNMSVDSRYYFSITAFMWPQRRSLVFHTSRTRSNIQAMNHASSPPEPCSYAYVVSIWCSSFWSLHGQHVSHWYRKKCVTRINTCLFQKYSWLKIYSKFSIQ